MKICLLGNNLTVKSGHARPAYVLAHELIAQGHEVAIIAERRSPARLAVEEAQLARLGLGGLTVERRFEGLTELALGGNALIRELWRRLGEFDVVHGFDLTTLWLLERAFGGAFPAPIVGTVASDLTVELGELARLGGGPLLRVATFPPYLWAAVAGARLLPRFLTVADRVIATSAHTVEQLARSGPVSHVRVVAPGLRWQAYAPPAPRSGPPVFLYFGWLSAIRGAQDAVAAFASIAGQIPGARLKIAVRGLTENVEDRLLARRYARWFADGSIQVTGFDVAMDQVLAQVDVVVLPFRSSFGYCQPAMALLEAMAAERAVISTPVGAVAEVVEDGVSGVLTPPGDVPALAARMLALARDSALRAALGAAARARVTALHDPAASARRTLEVYAEAIASGRARSSHWDRYGAGASYSVPATARDYDAVRFVTPAGAAFDALERAELESGVGVRPARVLEVGAGTARFASHLARLGHTVVACEISGPMLVEARRRLRHEGTAERVTLVQADGYRLPLADGAVDAALAVRVVNQIYADDDKTALLAELFRVVRPGGTVFFDLINANSIARLARPAGLIASADVCRLVEDELGGVVTRLTGRLVLPETLLRASPGSLVSAVERADAAVSAVLPAFATRTYVTARKLTPDERATRDARPREPRGPSPFEGLVMSGAMLATYGVSTLSSYLFSVMCARALGPEGFGALSALLAVQVMLAVPTVGVSTALTALIARFRAAGRPGAVLTAVLVPTGLLAVLAVAVAYLLTAAGAAEAFFYMPRGRVFYAGAWAIVQVIALGFLRNVQLVNGHVGAFIAGLLAECVARVALLLVLATVPLTVTGALVVYYLPATVGLVFAAYSLRALLAHAPEAIDLGELAALSSSGTFAYTLVCVLTSADVPLARHFLSAHAAGVYSAGSSIAKIALLLSSAVADPRLPALASPDLRARRDGIREVMLQTSTLCVLWAVMCLAVPEPVYRAMFGAHYGGVARVVGPLGVAAAGVGVVYAALKCMVVARMRWPALALGVAALVQVAGVALFHGDAGEVARVCLLSMVVALVGVLARLLRETGP